MAKTKTTKTQLVAKKKSPAKTKKATSFWRSKRGAIIAVVFVVLFAGIGVWQLQRSRAADTSTNINFMDKGTVNYYYNYLWKSGIGIPTGWTGSISGCNAGRSTETGHRAAINAINFARRLNGLTPITGYYDPFSTPNLNAQKAALIMDANGALDHTPPSSWKCWTKVGAATAGKSNLALQKPSTTPLGAVKSMLDEPGSGNGAVGHRRWLFNPDAVKFGFGFTARAAAIQVIGTPTSSTNNHPSWVVWPSRGYFPDTLAANGRWSITGKPYFCFNNASVRVVHNGANVALSVTSRAERGYANPTMVWQMPYTTDSVGNVLMKDPTGTYTVYVTNVNEWNSSTKSCKTGSTTKKSYTYSVYFYKPY